MRLNRLPSQIFLLTMWIALSVTTGLPAQDLFAPCSERLGEARRFAGENNYQAIIQLLEPCLYSDGFSEEEKGAAEKLLAVAEKRMNQNKNTPPPQVQYPTTRPVQIALNMDNVQLNERDLQTARMKFDKGQLDQVPPLLETIADSADISNEKRVEVLLLLTETYLQLHDTKRATNAFVRLWRANPHFQPNPKIHSPDFMYFVRRFDYYSNLWLSLHTGFGVDYIAVANNFSAPGTLTASEAYGNAGSWFFGAGMEYFPFDRKWSVSAALNFATYREYSYNTTFSINKSSGDAVAGKLSFMEGYEQFNLPVHLRYYWGKYDYRAARPIEQERKSIQFWRRLTPYVSAGMELNYLSTGNWNTIRESLFDASGGRIDISGNRDGIDLYSEPAFPDLRHRYTLSAFVGTGIQFRLSPKLALFFEGRYRFNLMSRINGQNRTADRSLGNYDFLEKYYVDDDILIRGISFTAGFQLPVLYRIKW